MTRPHGDDIDLRADLHGHVVDFVSDQDRRWFDAHPGETVRHRPALPHEFCDPRHLSECRPVFDPLPLPEGVEATLMLPEGVEVTLMVEVRRLSSWARTRQPYLCLARRTR